VTIINNLNERIQEARLNQWLAEVEGLQTSLAAAADKLTRLDRTASRASPVALGMPVVDARSTDLTTLM
jgi:hypothetical protein